MRIALSFLIYPFTMAHYFWRALERRDDVELFVLGPFTNDYIPWGGGMKLEPKYVKYPDLPMPQAFATKKVPSKSFEDMLPWKPDLFLMVDAGWHPSDRPPGDIVAHVQTDPHCLKQTYYEPKQYSDFSFCMQTPYMEEGEFYLPYAYDPEIHYPMDDVQKIYDTGLIGLAYKERLEILNKCIAKGLETYYNIGEVYDRFRIRYNQTRVAYNWSSLLDLPTRVFEYAAMGVPMVTNRVPDLNTFFVEKDHYLGCSNSNEAVENILFLLDNPDEAQYMADAAREKVKFHSWDNRITQLLEICKLI